jgi:hypothetical protein
MSPQWALQQYEVGVGIGQLSVGDDFDGVLPGELAGNRGLLRCLSGYGSCLWRLERRDEAARVFERVLRLDPTDCQGVRPLLSAMRAGAPWSNGGTLVTPDMRVIDRIAQVLASTAGCAGDVRDVADRERQRALRGVSKGFVNNINAQNCIGKQPQLIVRAREVATVRKS